MDMHLWKYSFNIDIFNCLSYIGTTDNENDLRLRSSKK